MNEKNSIIILISDDVMKKTKVILPLIFSIMTLNAQADVATAQKLADKYAKEAKIVDSNYAGLNAEAGKAFFNREVPRPKGDTKNPGKAIACASCHTINPANVGKHIVTGKSIAPLSPNVNAKRFANIKKVELGFTKHCNDVLGSDCSIAEKGNYIAYLLTEKTPTKK